MRDSYLPALRFRALTRFYDPVIAATTRERTFRSLLLDAAAPVAGERVVDLGCGTGSLAVLLAGRVADAEVIGVDPDPEMLAVARAKSGDVAWMEARAEQLPIEDGSVDLVVSSLVFHHLMPDARRSAAAEARRVLRPGGRLAIADWARPTDPLMWLASRSVRVFDGRSTVDSLAGRLPALLAETGFRDVAERGAIRTMFGRLAVHTARRA